MDEKSKRSFANGNGWLVGISPSASAKSQRDSGFDIRPESSWTVTLGR